MNVIMVETCDWCEWHYRGPAGTHANDTIDDINWPITVRSNGKLVHLCSLCWVDLRDDPCSLAATGYEVPLVYWGPYVTWPIIMTDLVYASLSQGAYAAVMGGMRK